MICVPGVRPRSAAILGGGLSTPSEPIPEQASAPPPLLLPRAFAQLAGELVELVPLIAPFLVVVAAASAPQSGELFPHPLSHVDEIFTAIDDCPAV